MQYQISQRFRDYKGYYNNNTSIIFMYYQISQRFRDYKGGPAAAGSRSVAFHFSFFLTY